MSLKFAKPEREALLKEFYKNSATVPNLCEYQPISRDPVTGEAQPIFLVRPHPMAPLFNNKPPDWQEIIMQLMRESQSKNLPTYSQEVREYLRQAMFVSLFFGLKYIAGASGPYELLTEDLNLDMCNFRQSDYCMNPGESAFSFIPRSHRKSTIFTHGADWWELVRNPDLRIRIVNAIVGKAKSFMRMTRMIFETNELFHWLAPEYIPDPNQPRWNEEEFVLPNRMRYYDMPSMKVGGATGAAEGDHHDLLNADDLVGLDDLNSEHGASAAMESKKQWWHTNSTALLVSPQSSRIMGVATRYAIDDVYDIPMNDAKKFIGWINDDFVEKENGRFTIYYRKAIENGRIILPEEFTAADYERIKRDDWWTWVTQYENDPQMTGLAEFGDADTHDAVLKWMDEYGWVILQHGDVNFEEKRGIIRLADCSVVMAIDPAATDKGMSARTSRTAIGVWACDWMGEYYRIDEAVGYFDMERTIDELFRLGKKYEGHIEETIVETNAYQKVLEKTLLKEQQERGVWINPRGVGEYTDKVGRIRSVLGLQLSKGKIWLCEGVRSNFEGERKVFPLSKYKMDVLDESTKAIHRLRTPEEPKDKMRRWLLEEEEALDVQGAFGY